MAQRPNTDDTPHGEPDRRQGPRPDNRGNDHPHTRASRVALVTGSAHGIGRAVVDRLLQQNWIVYGLDTAPQAAGDNFHPLRADVADPQAIESAIDVVRTGAGRLHGLVSNAGIMVRKPIAELSLADWNTVLATNLSALFLLAKNAQVLLEAANGASIVCIGSTRAHMSEPDTESYAASKGGLVALTHALSVSLGPRVRVNCISPGWIDISGEALSDADHAQHPAGRVGRPDDVAAMTTWLLGADSGFVTGAEFVIDGGMTRRMSYV